MTITPHNSVTPVLRRLRVLVIDDEPMIGLMIGRMLGPAYDVTCAHDGAAGLQALRDDAAFDLVLCDLMMPVMTGMDVYTALADRGSVHAQTLIFLTGGAFVGHAGQFLSNVVNPCLEKPFLTAELRTLVHHVVARHRLGER